MLKRALGLGTFAAFVMLLGAIVMSILTLVGCHSHKVTTLSLFEVRDPNSALNEQYDLYKVGQDGVCSYRQGEFFGCHAGHEPYYFQTDQIDAQGSYPSSSSFGDYQRKLRRLMRVAWSLLITVAAVDGAGLICLLLVAWVPYIAIPVYLILGIAQALCLAAAIIDTIIAYRVRHHLNKDNFQGITAHITHGGLALVWTSFVVRLLVVGLMFYLFSVFYQHRKGAEGRGYFDGSEAGGAHGGVAYVQAPSNMSPQYPVGATTTPPGAQTCARCQEAGLDPNCAQCRAISAERSTLGSPTGQSFERKLD